MSTTEEKSARDFRGVELTSFRYGRTNHTEGKPPRFYTFLAAKVNGEEVFFITYNKVAISLAQQLRLALSDDTDTPELGAMRDGGTVTVDVSGISVDIHCTGHSGKVDGKEVLHFDKFSPSGPTQQLEAALAAYKEAIYLAYTGNTRVKDEDIEIGFLSEDEKPETQAAETTSDAPVEAQEAEQTEPEADSAEDNTPPATEAEEPSAEAEASEAPDATPEEDTPSEETAAEQAPESSEPAADEAEKEFGSEAEEAGDFQEKNLNLEAEEKPAEAEPEAAPATKPKGPGRRMPARRGATRPQANKAEESTPEPEKAKETKPDPAPAPEEKPEPTPEASSPTSRPKPRPRPRVRSAAPGMR